MIYIILTLLIIHLYFAKPSNIMACGLFGCSVMHGDKIDTKVITILGLFNEQRGDDAVGIMTNSESRKSIKNSKFSDFISLELYYDTLISNSTSVLLGHTRNASPGTAKDKKTAQPCVTEITNKYGNIVNCGLIHNGNIKSAEDRIIELNGAKTNLSDSYDFHNVLLKTDNVKDELSKYIGKAALVWTDKNDDSIMYMFSGASPTTHGSKKIERERPLFYISIDESLYFSSTDDSLSAAFNLDDNLIVKTEKNTLYTVQYGQIIKEELIDRSNACQVKENTNINYGYRSDDNWGDFRGNRTNWGHYNTKKILRRNSLISAKSHGSIQLKEGRYIIGNRGMFITGFKIVSENGKLWHPGLLTSTTAKLFLVYFNSGHLIKVSNISEIVKDLLKYKHLDIRADKLLARNSYVLFKKTSAVPVVSPTEGGEVRIASINNGFANGTFKYFFTSKSAKFDNGDLVSVFELSNPTTLIPDYVGVSLSYVEAKVLYATLTSRDNYDFKNRKIITFLKEREDERIAKENVKKTLAVSVAPVFDLRKKEKNTVEKVIDVQIIEDILDELSDIDQSMDILSEELFNLEIMIESLTQKVKQNPLKDSISIHKKTMTDMNAAISITRAMKNMIKAIKITR